MEIIGTITIRLVVNTKLTEKELVEDLKALIKPGTPNTVINIFDIENIITEEPENF